MNTTEKNITTSVVPLRRLLRRATQVTRAIDYLRPSPPPPVSPCRLPPSLLACTGTASAAGAVSPIYDYDGYYTPSSSLAATPVGSASMCSRLGNPGDDVDKRTDEFIERTWPDVSLELRYCSRVTPSASSASVCPRLGIVLASPGDVDRRAEEFIKRFRRNASLELRNCSPVTPARLPMSPDTYFKHCQLHGADGGSRRSDVSIKWPSGPNYPTRRPTILVPGHT